MSELPPMKQVLQELSALVISERDAVNSPQLEAYGVFYNGFMTWAKYELKWYGVREVKEYFTMMQEILSPMSIVVNTGGDSVVDDDQPTYRFSLLTRLTQGLRVRCDDELWDEVIEQLVMNVVDIYPLVYVDPVRDQHVTRLDVYGEDVSNYLENKVVEEMFDKNPHLVTLALLGLLKHEELFVTPTKGDPYAIR